MKNIVLLGRPNVGKSSLFNRLVGKKVALTSSFFGTTRDYKTHKMIIENHNFLITDTAGIDLSYKNNSLTKRNNFITKYIEKADIILFMLDATIGITSEDLIISKHCLRSKKPIILLYNKSDIKNKKICTSCKKGETSVVDSRPT